MRKALLVLLVLSLVGVVPALAQISDPEGDADIPCVDIVSLDVRGDAQDLTVTVQTSMRPYPPTYVLDGVDADKLRLCPGGRYEFAIDTDLDGTADTELTTTLDQKGRPHTSGPLGLRASVNIRGGNIVWVVANEALGLKSARANVAVVARTGLTLSPGQTKVLVDTVTSDTAPNQWTPFTIGTDSAALIGPRGGRIEVNAAESSLNGSYLDIPAAAVSEPRLVTISVPEDRPLGFGVLDPLSHAEIGPHGLTFTLPATLGLAYRAEDLDMSVSLGAQYLDIFALTDDEPRAWEWIDSESLGDASLVRGPVEGSGVFAIMGPEAFPICHPRNPHRPEACAEEAAPDALDSRLPVLFVHGLQTILNCLEPVREPCQAGICDDSQADKTFGDIDEVLFEDSHYPVWYFNYNTAKHISETAAGPFALTINKILATIATGPKAVTVVAHSMGGLVARSYIAQSSENARRISGLLTAGTPHLGTDLWNNGRNCKSKLDMEPCSLFLESTTTLQKGINTLARENRALPSLACTSNAYDNYWFYVGDDDGVVAPMSGTGLSCDDYRDAYPNNAQACLEEVDGCTQESLPSHAALQLDGLDHSEVVWGDHGIVDISREEMLEIGSPEQAMMNEIRTFVQRPFCGSAQLVAYWPFDDDSNDKSGNGNTGTWTVGGGLDTGRFGNGYRFNPGVYYTVPSTPSLSASFTGITVAAWFKAGAVPSDNETLLGMGADGFNPKFHIFIVKSANGTSTPGVGVLGINDAGEVIGTEHVPIPNFIGAWHHIAATFDGHSTRIYVDGALQLERPNVRGTLTISAPLYMNRHDFGGWSSRLTGTTDEPVIFNRALSSSEIQALYSDADQNGEADFWQR